MGPTLQVGAGGAAAVGVSVAAGVGGVAGTGAGAGVVGVWALASAAIVITIAVPHCKARYDFRFVKDGPPKIVMLVRQGVYSVQGEGKSRTRFMG